MEPRDEDLEVLLHLFPSRFAEVTDELLSEECFPPSRTPGHRVTFCGFGLSRDVCCVCRRFRYLSRRGGNKPTSHLSEMDKKFFLYMETFPV